MTNPQPLEIKAVQNLSQIVYSIPCPHPEAMKEGEHFIRITLTVPPPLAVHAVEIKAQHTYHGYQ